MQGATLRPARATCLRWRAPERVDPREFANWRPRLERLLCEPRAARVYTANRRSIYCARDGHLGTVGIKEVRHPTALRRLWYGSLGERRAFREFCVASAFEARGGATPRVFGAALEHGRLGLERVFLVMRWLERAETLTEYLARVRGMPEPAFFDRLAQSLVRAARLGLVHGRHGSENLLVLPGEHGVDFYVIDFAYSRLGAGLDARGLVSDVARIAQWLLYARVCPAEGIDLLFDRVARAAWSEPLAVARGRAGLRRELFRLREAQAADVAPWRPQVRGVRTM